MDGLALMRDRYRYADCGLDYVYLLNGYTLHETEHGAGVSIEDARRLHERVALDIIGDPHPLRGQEVRFLRGMMKVSQEGLARVLRQRRGSVARWEAEANKAVPGAADSALRMFYALKAGGARDGGEGGRSVAGDRRSGARGVEGAGFAVSERWRVDAGGGLGQRR
jgi:putative transcriptional regulator